MLAAALVTLFGSAATAHTVTPENDEMPRVPPTGVTAHAAPRTTNSIPDKGALTGREVFSKDQLRVGQVEVVVEKSDGAVQAIRIKAGSFLGFGGKLVEIPHEKFWMRGTNVQLGLTSDEINHLPQVRDQM
jgi:hypothetical protein